MIKRLDSKNMKLVYENSLFKLIRVCEEGKENLDPIIFIEGQMGSFTQYLENKYNKNAETCYQYQKYFEYDDETHTPYIFLYNYPIRNIDKSTITNKLFAKELVDALDALKLENVTIMGISNGGMIGTLASKSDKVSKVLALHSPIFGTPILQRNDLEILKRKMIFLEKWVYYLSKIYINDNYGFMQENRDGFHHIQDISNLDKIIFTGSNIEGINCNSELASFLAHMNYRLLGKYSDGIVTFDMDKVREEGINFVEENRVSHFELGTPNYTTPYYENLIRKR